MLCPFLCPFQHTGVRNTGLRSEKLASAPRLPKVPLPAVTGSQAAATGTGDSIVALSYLQGETCFSSVSLWAWKINCFAGLRQRTPCELFIELTVLSLITTIPEEIEQDEISLQPDGSSLSLPELLCFTWHNKCTLRE